jgi:hypothetical protein
MQLVNEFLFKKTNEIKLIMANKIITLDKWLNIKSTFTKCYFILDWKKETPKCYWSDKKPKTFSFEHTVFWKNKRNYITLFGLFKESDNERFFYIIEENYTTPYLKSLLQKCIRRKRGKLAIKAIKHLIKKDITEAIRRLSIIIVEDVEVMYSFIVLTWMTSAISSKKFFVSKRMVEWILGVVHVLCEHDKHIIYKHLEISNTNTNTNFDLCRSIEFRKTYGGLKGDMYMLQKAVDYYKKNEYFKEKCIFIKWGSVKILTVDEWDTSAIDFHICNIVELLFKSYPQFSEHKIKKLIWDYRSGINLRDDTDKYIYSTTDRGDYEVIKKDLEKLSFYYLKKFN